MEHTIAPLGDRSFFVTLGEEISPETHHLVRTLTEHLKRKDLHWIEEVVPSYTGVAVYYDARALHAEFSSASPYETAAALFSEFVSGMGREVKEKEKVVEIPVCYGGDFGPDLSGVAKKNGLKEKEVMEIHSSREYLVYMLGFAPGFPFLGGMDETIATPRKASPRLSVPEGSVGIAGSQTGVYPVETPGGWMLIGRTPLSLFRPEEDPPAYLQPGDRVKFYPVSFEEYKRLEEE
ncbi:5-oxoprolinase subunit PxpB [Salimicrobium flavidum]|uniref:Inhibitor of KinA n=1 Tax=Salimicrobium flavidum TaxID=570947 RepID=A0A1N7JJG5_9BACI|nr:5-oxoprolinase subunit PxpB [Salimicrobium flavidum]SIS49411.1 inhibitor of KinA [Salimicrobium flavidum]